MKWWSSIRWFSQIWLHTRYESRKKTESFYILGCLLELIIKIWWFGKNSFEIWRIWAIFSTEYPSYRLKSYFPGWNLVKLHPKKNHCVCNGYWSSLYFWLEAQLFTALCSMTLLEELDNVLHFSSILQKSTSRNNDLIGGTWQCAAFFFHSPEEHRTKHWPFSCFFLFPQGEIGFLPWQPLLLFSAMWQEGESHAADLLLLKFAQSQNSNHFELSRPWISQ